MTYLHGDHIQKETYYHQNQCLYSHLPIITRDLLRKSIFSCSAGVRMLPSLRHVPIIQSTCYDPSRSFSPYIQLWLFTRHVQSLADVDVQCQALKIWHPRRFSHLRRWYVMWDTLLPLGRWSQSAGSWWGQMQWELLDARSSPDHLSLAQANWLLPKRN